MNLLQLTHTTSDWSALVEADDGRRATLTFTSKPTKAEALAVAQIVFSPPTARVVGEDGVALDLTDATALTVNLTALQKTAIRSALITLNGLADAVAGKLPTSPESLAAYRVHSPLLNDVLTLVERLRP